MYRGKKFVCTLSVKINQLVVSVWPDITLIMVSAEYVDLTTFNVEQFYENTFTQFCQCAMYKIGNCP